MMTGFDDIFDAALSTILHVSMKMCRGREIKSGAVSFVLATKTEKSLTISHFLRQKSIKTIP
ncbi:hypothetical protein [Rhizobium sp. N541]|uniref:hypothetical protein n=1 Tax=Rhizobium sp. N541 TaxID=1703970 RepID=UPI000AF78435|nr:hypothetical protein [Rhizobium sp. N541]